MFAKPAPKKQVPAGTKAKTLNKPKTVSVKTGVKAPQGKKTKSEVKKSLKPPPRPDAGYSLYSSDNEDQVSLALNDMELCEKLLTQIKHNQQEADKQQKPKGKKKKKDKSPLPKPLNENPHRTDIIPGFSSIYGTTYPYGTSLFLRQLQSQDYANNPIFNTRLTSSTPDPEKHLADLSASKLPRGTDFVSQDVPEKDVSAVSSVPPSFNHLQNMADMVDIYKRIEFNKFTELQEAAARAELEKFKAFQGASVKDTQTESGHNGQEFAEENSYNSRQNIIENTENLSENVVGRPSDGFVGTGSLGFSLPAADSVFRPVVPGSSLYHDSNMNIEEEQDSSLTAFQPYLSGGDSREMLPPQGWIQNNPAQSQGHIQNMDNGQPSSQNSTLKDGGDQEIPLSGRTDYSEESKGTEYNVLVRQSEADGHAARTNTDGKVVFEKQNGLFQLHLKKSSDQSSSGNDSKSDKSESTTKGQGSLDEVPERDMPAQNSKPSDNSSQSTKDGTFRAGLKNDSQNLSEVATSTPRNTNNSGNSSSTSSYGGKIVFIPDNSNTQNVIGYVPGLPVIPGTNQPMSMPVTNDIGNTVQSGSILSSAVGQQAPHSVSQMTSQVGTNASCYQSARHAQTIAAGDIGVRKLRYLLKELKECTKVTKDVEVTRLVTEIDSAVNAIPQLSMTFNLQTEIDLAIQPLRSENSQLRRKLRLLNQHLKEKELSSSEEPKDVNFEILHLQTSNDTLQKVLKEEKEIKTRLAAEVQYLYNEIHKMKVEKSKLIASTSEKETEQLKLRQEMTLETQRLKHDLDLIKKDQESMGNKMEAIEKENHILQITLQQRDEEIARQAEIVETMKESISDLLGELEQSRVGEKTWDHNNSYGLHRLMKIVEEEGAGFPKGHTERKQVRTTDRKARTPERRAFDFNISDSTTSTTRLTRAALAYHDRRHHPVVGRLGPDGRQGPASESELDTLVEMYSRNKPTALGQGKIDRPCQRRTSSSSPVRLRNDPAGGNLRHQRTATSPNYGKNFVRDAGGKIGKGTDKVGYYSRPREYTMGQDSDDEQELSPSRRPGISKRQSPYRRVSKGAENVSPERRARSKGRVAMATEGSEISVEQSRYSVTDYFKKYHPEDNSAVRPKEPLSDERNLPPSGRASRFYKDNIVPGQSRRDNDTQGRFALQFRTSSEIDDRTVKSSDVQPNRNVRPNKFFKGMRDDQTISAINDDDNFSSVSMSSVTTANTVDERKFRSGIATLDANIARLQQALQKTKSMLT